MTDSAFAARPGAAELHPHDGAQLSRSAGLISGVARWVLTDRTGGTSAAPYGSLNLAEHVGDDADQVARNRAVVARSVGVPPDRLVGMRPDHGNCVAVLNQAPAVDVPDVDVLVTAEPGLALLVQAADCVPVLLCDPEAGVIAVAHAGWRGVLRDTVGAALAAMADLRARADRTHALIGPAICPACYPVPEERRAAVAAVAPQAWAVTGTGDPALDLRVGIVARLVEVGVRARLLGGCTAGNPDLFSFRRDGVTGRQGGAVVLLSTPLPTA